MGRFEKRKDVELLATIRWKGCDKDKDTEQPMDYLSSAARESNALLHLHSKLTALFSLLTFDPVLCPHGQDMKPKKCTRPKKRSRWR